MRLQLLIGISLVCGSVSQAMASGHGSCGSWSGTYVGHLGEDDTFTGSSKKFTLSVERSGIGWNVVGDGVPEIILGADRYRCEATRIAGSFSGSHMTGRFTLSRRGAAYIFDASDVGKGAKEGPNLLGYVPNRAIMLRRIP
ncbi:MAG: hypothetical protein ABIU10_07740 [Sphingomicrobium sp.]